VFHFFLIYDLVVYAMSDVSEWTIRVTICWEWWIWFQTSFRTDRCYNRYNTITL